MAAQATSGSIEGFITDPTGARVPDARVVVREESSGLEKATQTNGLGEYAVAGLPPGRYRITAGKSGFQPFASQPAELAIDQKLRADATLQLGTLESAPVQVIDSSLQTQTAETGETIRSSQILGLPLLGRNFLELSLLTPGAAVASGGNTLNIAVNGQREFANSILIDGVEASANRNNDTTLRPSVDSVEEFRILTSSYSAEFGRASGAVIAIETRSGGNRFHGSLYEFFRPNVTAARTFFAPVASPLKQHNFGGTAGGPVRRNRTFFFASSEEARIRTSYSFLDSVPPAGQIRVLPGGAVDLSRLKDPFSGNQVPIFDPNFYAANYYSSPFPGNVIPASRVSPAGKAVLQQLFPSPTLPGIYNGWYSNFDSTQAYAFDSHTAGGRLDHVFSEKDRLSAVYHFNAFGSTTGDRFAGHIPIAGGGDADYGDQEDSRSQQLALSEDHTFGGRWLNQARFGYTRYRLDQLSLLHNQNLASQLGMANVNLPGFPQTSGLPDIYLGFGAQTGGSTYKPLYFLDSNQQFGDTMTARLGAHDFKAGAEFRRLTSNPFFSLFPTGFQYYAGAGASLTSDPNYGFYDPGAFYYNGGSDIADLLLGLPYTVNLGLQLTNPSTRSWEGSLFVQDIWQATPSLSISYGLRYEYAAPWTEVSNRAANFDFTSHQMLLAGVGGNSASLVQPDRNNFAPRVGVAWRAGSHLVVRAGWGIYYSPENDAREDVLTKNFPFAPQQTVFNNIYGGLPFSYLLDSGVARMTSVPPLSAATGQNVFAVDAGMRTGYSQLYNLAVEHSLGSATTIEAAYVGSASRKLPYAVGNVNLANRVTPLLGQIQALFSEGSAGFNSLQWKVRRRYHALTFLAGYTLGKNMDNGPAPFNLGHNQNAHNQPQNPFNLAAERAVADGDVQHNVVGSFLYRLPRSRNPVLRDWAVAGIFTARSGLPVNVVRNAGNTNLPGLRPDVLRSPMLPAGQRTLIRYFDTAAFDITPFTKNAAQNSGNAGRNIVRGPGMQNLDFSLSRTVRWRELVSLEIRADAFNLANTAHFANPDGAMSDGSFGSITQTIGNPRIAQFSAKFAW
ncbi:MAG: TonB-dependent receptor [Candidatus Sulfopaludibacter sp.]|nr:TonB-dependent receptor [Candidatus Sulfopaludibacter sp.]